MTHNGQATWPAPVNPNSHKYQNQLSFSSRQPKIQEIQKEMDQY